MNPVIEKARVLTGLFASTEADGFNGAFELSVNGERLRCIASNRMGWEHVSVSKAGQPNKVPNWAAMCEIKNLFWGEDVWVVQFHPAKADYVNNHPGCLHLWRPTDSTFPTPPSLLTGWKDKTPEDIQKMGHQARLRGFLKMNSDPSGLGGQCVPFEL